MKKGNKNEKLIDGNSYTTFGYAINCNVEHWHVECPKCERLIEYEGYYDSSDIETCKRCGCRFLVEKLWIDENNYIE